LSGFPSSSSFAAVGAGEADGSNAQASDPDDETLTHAPDSQPVGRSWPDEGAEAAGKKKKMEGEVLG